MAGILETNTRERRPLGQNIRKNSQRSVVPKHHSSLAVGHLLFTRDDQRRPARPQDFGTETAFKSLTQLLPGNFGVD
jgi:hypothetical protein